MIDRLPPDFDIHIRGQLKFDRLIEFLLLLRAYVNMMAMMMIIVHFFLMQDKKSFVLLSIKGMENHRKYFLKTSRVLNNFKFFRYF